jgi:hypothetical protein
MRNYFLKICFIAFPPHEVALLNEKNDNAPPHKTTHGSPHVLHIPTAEEPDT